MSNHTHVVLHVDQETAQNWSVQEVLVRWHKLHKGTEFTQEFVREGTVPEYAMAFVDASAETYRKRLMDISWFMRELNEPTGRAVRQDKRGSIDVSLAPILQRLNITSDNWLQISTQFEQVTSSAVGSESALRRFQESKGHKRRSSLAGSRLFVLHCLC